MRHGVDPGLALAGVLGVNADDIRLRDRAGPAPLAGAASDDRGAAPDADRSQYLVAVPLIERDVSRVAAFEIGGRTVAVEDCVCMLHQQRTKTLILSVGINAD